MRSIFRKADAMATFVTLYKYTEQGLRTIKDGPKRLEAGQSSEPNDARVHAGRDDEDPRTCRLGSIAERIFKEAGDCALYALVRFLLG